MKVLVTGANGFVGPHLVAELRHSLGATCQIFSTSRVAGHLETIGAVEALDVTDVHAVYQTIDRIRPDCVVHLAGLASIRAAIANTAVAWQVHLFGSLNIANAIQLLAPDCVLVYISSGQIYGASAQHGLPLDEATILAPTNGYEVTKAAADLAIGALSAQKLRSIRMRPFNHTGPGQSIDFVVPSFAHQIARIEAGQQQPVIRVGNLDAERDFLDVRDVVRAYSLAVARSNNIAPGTIINVASGTPLRISELLDRMIALSGREITIERDPARLRPSDTPRFVGDASLARRLLDWSPRQPISQTLENVVNYYRQRVSQPQISQRGGP